MKEGKKSKNTQNRIVGPEARQWSSIERDSPRYVSTAPDEPGVWKVGL